MALIKICGITRAEDALACAELNIFAVGFVFYPQDPRYIHPQEAKTIIDLLPSDLLKVGVFENAPADAIVEVAREVGLDNVQLNGEESPEYWANLDHLAYKSFKVGDETVLEQIPKYITAKNHGFRLDVGSPHDPARETNLEIANQANSQGNLILAGGFTPASIAAVLDQVHPYAVDITSGTEELVGKKDKAKLLALVDAVENWNRKIFKARVEYTRTSEIVTSQ